MKVQNRPQRKRLKPDHLEGLKIHEESFSLPWGDVYGLGEASWQEKTQHIVVVERAFSTY
jgi:hypothetical protein